MAEFPSTSPAAPSGTGRRRLVQAVLGAALSVGLIALILAKVDVNEVGRHLRSARPLPLLLAVVLATVPFALRVFRWRILLRAEGGGAIRYGPLWHAIAMGFTANNVLPFRAGEVIRTIAITRLGGVRFTAALSSVAVERVFDGVAVLFLLTLALFSPGMPPGVSVGGVPVAQVATRAGIVVAAALVAGALVVSFPQWAERAVRAVVPFPRLAERLVGLIEGVVHGLHVLRSPGKVLLVLAWSVGLWAVNGLSFYAAFAAFDIPVNVAGALLVQGILILGISIPSTPGYVGVFEAAAMAGLAIYGVPAEKAFSYGLAYHVTTFLPITLLGLWSLLRTNLRWRELRGEAAEGRAR